jgi:hypothetical protein
MLYFLCLILNLESARTDIVIKLEDPTDLYKRSAPMHKCRNKSYATIPLINEPGRFCTLHTLGASPISVFRSHRGERGSVPRSPG